VKIIRVKHLAAKIGLSVSTIWRMEKAGLFPKRRRISAGAVGWLESEVDEWLKTREAA
jgi:prophage regulatory protein